MKKIAIVTRQMIAGGIEKALISMLEVIPNDQYEVTLFVMASGGEFEKFIPKWINVKNLYGDEKTIIEKVINKMRKGKFVDAFRIGFYSFKSLRAIPGYQQEGILAKILPRENEIFDLAIAYHVPASFPVVYVVEHLKAKKKVAWIHSDVEVYKRYLSNYIDYYGKFDKIYCVSEYGKTKFDKQYPNLSEKTEVIHNIINYKQLDKSIVTTNFVGAVEQIKNNENGLIVRFDEREIEESIIKIIEDDKFRDKLFLNLSKSKDINNLEIEKLYTLME